MELDLKSLRQAIGAPLRAGRKQQSRQILNTEDPYAFWLSFLHNLENRTSAALPDPGWPNEWRRELTERAATEQNRDTILIATSGSTGRPKWCRHSIATLGAAADGFVQRFGAQGLIHSVVVLPQHHVGGIMPVLRSAASQGKVAFASYRQLHSLANLAFDPKQASLSIVPTQLNRLLLQSDGPKTLRRFGAIFIGGAASAPALLEKARSLDIPLAPCFGSTETAAMITAMNPADFLQGSSGTGQTMPHATISISPENRIQVSSQALFKGYLDESPHENNCPFAMPDFGKWDASGSLHILGRADRIIQSGAELVHPNEIEKIVQDLFPGSNPSCIGIPDEDWGERIELVLSSTSALSCAETLLMRTLKEKLPPAAVPKRIVFRRNNIKE